MTFKSIVLTSVFSLLTIYSCKSTSAANDNAGLAAATGSSGCYGFTGNQPAQVGPVALLGRANVICVRTVNKFGTGTQYAELSLTNNADGSTAFFTSDKIASGRCLTGFCKSYTLTSGVVGDQNLEPKDLQNTVIEFHVEGTNGTIKIGNETFNVTGINR